MLKALLKKGKNTLYGILMCPILRIISTYRSSWLRAIEIGIMHSQLIIDIYSKIADMNLTYHEVISFWYYKNDIRLVTFSHFNQNKFYNLTWHKCKKIFFDYILNLIDKIEIIYWNNVPNEISKLLDLASVMIQGLRFSLQQKFWLNFL